MKTTVHTRQSALFMLLLALIALVALTLPYAFNLTWATPGAPDHQLTYRQDSLTWDSATGVNGDGSARLTLFQNQYDSVRSENGSTIAPGTSGHNTIRLKNAVSGAVRYTAVLYRLGAADVPVQPVLSGASAAETSQFALPEGVQNSDVVRAVTGTLSGNSVENLDVDWTWPYEADADAVDTAAGSENASVTLGLYVIVQDENTYEVLTPRTGDTAQTNLALVLFILSLLGVAVLSAWFLYQRRQSR